MINGKILYVTQPPTLTLALDVHITPVNKIQIQTYMVNQHKHEAKDDVLIHFANVFLHD